MKIAQLLRNDANFVSAVVEQSGEIPASAHLSMITNLDSLRCLGNDWRDLETRCQKQTSVFQSFDWIMAWCETYATLRPDLKIQVLTGYDQGKLVFVWPMMQQSRMGLNILGWLTEPFGQYGDVLCASGHCPKLWTKSSLNFLHSLKGIDIIRLRHVRMDSHLATSCLHLFSNAKSAERAPFLDLTQFQTEADYEQRYTQAQRKRRKKIRKHLEDIGSVSFIELAPGTIADAAIESAIAEKNQWLEDRGRLNRVLNCPGHITFLKKLSRRSNSNVEVVVSEIKANDEPISWEIGFRHGKTHFAYITSHMNKHTDLSPGRLHMDLSQRASLAAGMERFDLMVPYDAHKESWSSGSVDTQDHFVPLSAKGWLAGYVYLKTLRPVIRKIYYSLQPNALRWLSTRTAAASKVMASIVP